MRRRLSLSAGVLMTLVIAVWPFSAAGRGVEGDATCEYVELGPAGAVGNELRLVTDDYVGEVEVDRRVDQLVVTGDGGGDVPCSGPELPTVTNVDRISVRVARESLDSLILDLRGGHLEPGATAEADGTSEIEVSLEEAPGTVLAVIGTRSDDHIELGSIGGGTYGANLNAAEEETPDADVTGRNAYVFVGLGSGDDRVNPRGRTSFATGPFAFAFSAFGGRGDDRLVGNDRKNLLAGDKGRDRLVDGGLGDRLSGGADRDSIQARDRHRDVVSCGPGDDVALTDPFDRRDDCE